MEGKNRRPRSWAPVGYAAFQLTTASANAFWIAAHPVGVMCPLWVRAIEDVSRVASWPAAAMSGTRATLPDAAAPRAAVSVANAISDATDPAGCVALVAPATGVAV